VKIVFDLLPLVVFFVAFKLADIFVATGLAIATTVVLIGMALVRRRPVPPMQWATLIIIVVFGGATLVLHDDTFIKWKPTVLYWAGAMALLGSLVAKRNLVKSIIGSEISLPEGLWTRVCIAWGIFFALLGCLNLYVAFNYTTASWVNFKVFATPAIVAAFAIVQSFWITRELPEEPAASKTHEPRP
jgi:intracellular septation protein